MENKISGKVRNQVYYQAQLKDKVSSQVYSQVKDQVENLVYPQVRTQIMIKVIPHILNHYKQPQELLYIRTDLSRFESYSKGACVIECDCCKGRGR